MSNICNALKCVVTVVVFVVVVNIFMVRHSKPVVLFAPYISTFISCDCSYKPWCSLIQLRPVLFACVVCFYLNARVVY